MTIDEGTTVTLTGVTFTDSAGTDPHTATIDWDDGSPIDNGVVDDVAGTVSGSHDYTVVGTYTVTVTVTNNQSSSGSNSFTVQVNNVQPTVAPIAVETAGVGTTFNLSGATFTDPGTQETHTAVINWADRSPLSVGTVNETTTPAGMSGTVTGSHVYSVAGVYDGTVTVTDSHAPLVRRSSW